MQVSRWFRSFVSLGGGYANAIYRARRELGGGNRPITALQASGSTCSPRDPVVVHFANTMAIDELPAENEPMGVDRFADSATLEPLHMPSDIFVLWFKLRAIEWGWWQGALSDSFLFDGFNWTLPISFFISSSIDGIWIDFVRIISSGWVDVIERRRRGFPGNLSCYFSENSISISPTISKAEAQAISWRLLQLLCSYWLISQVFRWCLRSWEILQDHSLLPLQCRAAAGGNCCEIWRNFQFKWDSVALDVVLLAPSLERLCNHAHFLFEIWRNIESKSDWMALDVVAFVDGAVCATTGAISRAFV